MPFFEAMRRSGVPLTVSDRAVEDTPLVLVNDRFMALTGYDEHAALGRNCRFLQPDDGQRAARAAFRDAIGAGEAGRGMIVNERADGSAFVNYLFMLPLGGTGPDARYMLGSQFDITDRLSHNDIERHLETLANAVELVVDREDSRQFLGSLHVVSQSIASIIETRMTSLLADLASRGMVVR